MEPFPKAKVKLSDYLKLLIWDSIDIGVNIFLVAESCGLLIASIFQFHFNFCPGFFK